MKVVLFPLEKLNQFVLDFPSALVTFHFHMLFLIEKEHTDAKNCRISYKKSKLKTRNLDILSSPSPTQRLATVSHLIGGTNGSIINFQVFYRLILLHNGGLIKKGRADLARFIQPNFNASIWLNIENIGSV